MNKITEFGLFRFVTVVTLGALLALRSNDLNAAITTIISVFAILVVCMPIALLIPKKSPVAHIIGVIIAVRIVSLTLFFLPEILDIPQDFVLTFGYAKGAYLLLLSPLISSYVLFGRKQLAFGWMAFGVFLPTILLLGTLRHSWSGNLFFGRSLLRLPPIYVLMNPAGILMIIAAATATVVFIYRRRGHWAFKMIPRIQSGLTIYSQYAPQDNERSLLVGMLGYSLWTGFLVAVSTLLMSAFSSAPFRFSVLSLAVVFPTIFTCFFSKYSKSGRLLFSDSLINYIILPAHVLLVILPSEMLSVELKGNTFAMNNILIILTASVFTFFVMFLSLLFIRVSARKALFSKPFNCIEGGAMTFGTLSMLVILAQLSFAVGEKMIAIYQTGI